jgi:hypothetical protein
MVIEPWDPHMSEGCERCFVKHIRDWYRGKYVPYENDPNSSLFVVGGYYHRHWTSRLVHTAFDFYRAEWKWVLGTAMALLFAYLKL